MSTKLCERCKRRIKAEAVSCICGWSLVPHRPRAPERVEPPVPWAESKAAYERVKGSLTYKPRTWNRQEFIEHYKKILANPQAAGFAKAHANEALRNLGVVSRDDEQERRTVEAELAAVKEKMAAFERVPGEDDEESNAVVTERDRRDGMEGKPQGVTADNGSRDGHYAAAEQGANPHPATTAPALGIRSDK